MYCDSFHEMFYFSHMSDDEEHIWNNLISLMRVGYAQQHKVYKCVVSFAVVATN